MSGVMSRLYDPRFKGFKVVVIETGFIVKCQKPCYVATYSGARRWTARVDSLREAAEAAAEHSRNHGYDTIQEARRECGRLAGIRRREALAELEDFIASSERSAW